MPSYQVVFFAFLMIWNWNFINATLLKPRIYEIRKVNSTCTSQEIKIRLDFNRNFRGFIYAKGFPLEKTCSTYGSGEDFVEIFLDTSECGVRLVASDDETLTYRVTLNVQMDRFLQQITDLEVTTTCDLSVNLIFSKEASSTRRQISRTGRNKLAEAEESRRNDLLNQIKSWMEIEGTTESQNANKVYVGDQTMMIIKSFLPDNLDANVVDCYAYDGTREVFQKLIDDNGCPLDETIMPSLELIKYENEISTDVKTDWFPEMNRSKFGREYVGDRKKIKSEKSEEKKGIERKKLSDVESEGETEKKSRFMVMGTIFSAFKFPDTSNLHLRCTLLICRKSCPRVDCNSDAEASHDRIGKSFKSENNMSSVIEKIEVFNSVEVLAPGIDADGFSSRQDGVDSKLNLEENLFCLSASKMAFSFAILGAVFLCGVLAALWTVMRNHLRKVNKMDGSEQILVVRDSPLNFTNVRKMHHNWSYS